jgi:hypothetical protein
MQREPIPDKSVLKKNYGLRLNQALMLQLKHLAVDQKERRINDLIEEAIRDLLKKYAKK